MKQGADAAVAMAMAMGQVILKEFYVDRQVPYFLDYVRRYSDMAILVRLVEQQGRYVPERLLRASDFDARVRRNSSFSNTVVLILLFAQLSFGLITITVPLRALDGHEMVKFMNWAQAIPTLQPGAATYVADVHPIFKLHMLLGMTIFLVFPFTRLVHVWSAPVWNLGRTGYQIVRTRRSLPRAPAAQAWERRS